MNITNQATDFIIRNQKIRVEAGDDWTKLDSFLAEFRAASQQFWPTDTGHPMLDCAGEVNIFADDSAIIWQFCPGPGTLAMRVLGWGEVRLIRATAERHNQENLER